MKELAKVYDPSQVEDKTYAFWMEGGWFTPGRYAGKQPYTIVMPPPNITGQLHMGHAMDNTWQDILIRHKRMQGYAALWVPGTDHASIATEARVVVALKAEGQSKESLGRDAFLERVWAWKEQYGSRIGRQLRKMGSSCDWSRERFTMDAGCSRAVRHVFKALYDEGLIYKGERIINWCPTCLTSISDAEVEHAEQNGHFWHIRYPVAGEAGRFVELATTRPETMLGDTAIAVNPKDERYRDLIGKTVLLPLMEREIPVVADAYVDMDFGTGVVKITPAHDPNDFEVGRRHNLPIIKVMRDDAHINENGGKYAGMDRYAAREAVLADLEADGYLVKTEAHVYNVGTCYRCGTTIEPMVSLQWFVKMEPLAKPAIEAVEEGTIRFEPERFTKTYLHWMENTRDWTISRQLWWGHRIPAWYCDACGYITVSEDTPEKCEKCGSAHIHQDEDTLDTWFSSALWPYSTLGWPDETDDYKYFYPTSTLVTGYEIIGFWVSRMIFTGLHFTGKAPFSTVLIHGMVRDDLGRKMSKSLDNGIDPLDVIAEYGADALRLMLVLGSTPGNDMRFNAEKIKSARNFANKLWNAARFVLMNLDEDFEPGLPDVAELELSDKWALSLYNRLITEATENLERFEFGLAAQKIHDFIWETFCDWTIEIAKARLTGTNAQGRRTAQKLLVWLLSGALKLLHPFMPFITEEIFRVLPGGGETIMTQAWPLPDKALAFMDEAADFGAVVELIGAVRAMRSEMNVHPAKKANIVIETGNAAPYEASADVLRRLAGAESVTCVAAYTGDGAGMVQVATPRARGFLPFLQLVDREKELARLAKEKAAADAEVQNIEARLQNKGFVDKAPPALVQEFREKLQCAKAMSAKLDESIRALN